MKLETEKYIFLSYLYTQNMLSQWKIVQWTRIRGSWLKYSKLEHRHMSQSPNFTYPCGKLLKAYLHRAIQTIEHRCKCIFPVP